MSTTTYRIIRFAFVLLFLWFGIEQLMDPGSWTSFLPGWLGYLPAPGEVFVQMNGWFEIVFAVLLGLGLFTRFVSVILGVHLLMIAATAGGAIGMRDAVLGLTMVAFGFSFVDDWGLDARWHKPASPVSDQVLPRHVVRSES